jgi:hypothetical protein
MHPTGAPSDGLLPRGSVDKVGLVSGPCLGRLCGARSSGQPGWRVGWLSSKAQLGRGMNRRILLLRAMAAFVDPRWPGQEGGYAISMDLTRTCRLTQETTVTRGCGEYHSQTELGVVLPRATTTSSLINRQHWCCSSVEPSLAIPIGVSNRRYGGFIGDILRQARASGNLTGLFVSRAHIDKERHDACNFAVYDWALRIQYGACLSTLWFVKVLRAQHNDAVSDNV